MAESVVPSASEFLSPSPGAADIVTEAAQPYAPNNFIRIDPIDPWTEVRFDIIIPITFLYMIVASCILCPPNFVDLYRRFKEFRRSFE